MFIFAHRTKRKKRLPQNESLLSCSLRAQGSSCTRQPTSPWVLLTLFSWHKLRHPSATNLAKLPSTTPEIQFSKSPAVQHLVCHLIYVGKEHLRIKESWNAATVYIYLFSKHRYSFILESTKHSETLQSLYRWPSSLLFYFFNFHQLIL